MCAGDGGEEPAARADAAGGGRAARGPGWPEQCQLEYPDKYEAARRYVRHATRAADAGAPQNLTEDHLLALDAFEKQAEHGPCTDAAPWAWNAQERARWTVYSQLGSMSKYEAMFRYVSTVELDCPSWWAELKGFHARGEAEAAASADRGTEWDVPVPAVPDGVSWMALGEGSPGAAPTARYEHAACVLGGALFVCGGNSGRRLLNDVHVLDVAPLASGGEPLWRVAEAPEAQASSSRAGSLPPVAGLALVRWADTLLAVGGRQRSADAEESMTVHALDATAARGGAPAEWRRLECAPDAHFGAPCARRLHSAVVHGDSLFVFGGEAAQSRALGDLWRLDLKSWTWHSPVSTGAAPSARSAHAAAVYAGRMHVFGGCSFRSTAFFNDVHTLDLRTLEWSVSTTSGQAPAPRAGHASCVHGPFFFVAGGGNNESGLGDTVVLDMRTNRMEWSVLCAAPKVKAAARGWQRRPAAASQDAAVAYEGMSLVALPSGNGRVQALLALGGYNGRTSAALRMLPLEAAFLNATAQGAANGKRGGRAEGIAVEGVQRAVALVIDKIGDAEVAVQALATAARPSGAEPHVRAAASAELDLHLEFRSRLFGALQKAQGLRALVARVETGLCDPVAREASVGS